LAIAGLVAAGATAWAATSSGSSSPASAATAAPSPGHSDHWGGWAGHWGGWSGHWGGWSGAADFQRALHGECVSAKQGGGTQTTVFQRGTVTAETANSVTVRSSDGFTQRYAVGADLLVGGEKKGIGAIPKNKEIVVIALKGQGDPAAQRVFDVSGH
jgi:hypothetical protein